MLVFKTAIEADLGGVWRSGKRSRRAVGKCPLTVVDQLFRIILMNAFCQGSACIAAAYCRIGGRSRYIYCVGGGIIENIFGAHGAGNFRTAFVRGDRKIDLNACRNVAFPSAPDECVTFGLEETIACSGGAAADIERRGAFVAAVDDIVKDCSVSAASVDRLEDRKIHRVLDHAAGIARCQLNVLYNRVQRILRVDLAEGSAVELFVLADLAKGLAGEGGRCRRGYRDPCNARINRGCHPD